MLKIDNLSAGYGQSTVLNDISFAVASKEVLAIVGRNGMGKTTLMRTLLGILPANQGSIHLGGQDITNLPTYRRVHSGIAYVPQGRMIFPSLTVMENMLTGARSPVPPAVFDEIYDLFPDLYKMRGRKGGNLSGGQQQQLAIARALLTDPKVLVLDEPTEGIQPSIIKDVARILRRIRDARNLAIVVTEQVLSFVLDSCDRLMVMERGRFIHEDLRANVDANKVKSLIAV